MDVIRCQNDFPFPNATDAILLFVVTVRARPAERLAQ